MTRTQDIGGLGPRRAALWLLRQVLDRQRMLSDCAEGLSGLPAAERARARRLALMVLRDLGRADLVLGPLLRSTPPLVVRNALRLGVCEMARGAAPHGVVNDLVAIVGSDRRCASMKGLVNAVLRRAAEGLPARWECLPVPELPRWLREPLVAAWGGEAVAAMEAAHLRGASLDLTAKGDAAALAQAVGGRLLPTGSVRLEDAGQVSALPGYAAGDWWVQDAAAALPARLLAPRPGERILDLCAAPGGKTLQLAAAGARVTALDLSDRRLGRLRDNLARTGLSAEVVAGDVMAFDRGGWDAILLDAPCSATGTIRRHPELPLLRDGSGMAELIGRQAALIDHALGLLRPGGRLVFCTCSLLPEEGEVQAAGALGRHAGLRADAAAAAALPGVDPGWITAEGGLRLRPDVWPEAGGMDGFFMVLLRKPA